MSEDLTYTPYDVDANDQPAAPMVLGERFAYIGAGMSLPQFTTYLATYDFGPIPPDFVVLHHTAIPAASYAPYGDPARFWDAGEQGLPEQAIYAKRKRTLDGIMRYYRDALGWPAGPHLFIDERWIWLMTPMADIGVHARSGNAYRVLGRLHYSIGIEVVGYYGSVRWPPAVERLVGGAVVALARRLGTIQLRHTRGAGGISSHRDWGKPECPGNAISTSYYLGVLARAASNSANDGDRYRVKATVTAGAVIRGAPRTNAANLGKLHAGDEWRGGEVAGQRVTIQGFGSSDVWICSAEGHCVWSGLLERDDGPA